MFSVCLPTFCVFCLPTDILCFLSAYRHSSARLHPFSGHQVEKTQAIVVCKVSEMQDRLDEAVEGLSEKMKVEVDRIDGVVVPLLTEALSLTLKEREERIKADADLAEKVDGEVERIDGVVVPLLTEALSLTLMERDERVKADADLDAEVKQALSAQKEERDAALSNEREERTAAVVQEKEHREASLQALRQAHASCCVHACLCAQTSSQGCTHT